MALRVEKNISLTVLPVLSSSSHIRSVLIGIKYQNWHRILDVYLLFVIWMGQIQFKVKTDLHVCNLWTGQFVSYKSVIYFGFDLTKQNTLMCQINECTQLALAMFSS
jgi:hypothetical protein